MTETEIILRAVNKTPNVSMLVKGGTLIICPPPPAWKILAQNVKRFINEF